MKDFENFSKAEIRAVKSTSIRRKINDFRKDMVHKKGNVFMQLPSIYSQDMALSPKQKEDNLIYLIPAIEFEYEVDTEENVDFETFIMGGPDMKKIVTDLSALKQYVQHDHVLPETKNLVSTKLKKVAAKNKPAMKPLPTMIDHRPRQSPVKNQGNRGTCVAHATCGALEAIYQKPFDLSEQLAHARFNNILGRDHRLNKGLRTTDAASFLTSPNLICEEYRMPYMARQADVIAACNNTSQLPIPNAAQNNANYGIKKSVVVGDSGLVGRSIRNTKYLESILAAGHNIVLGTWVAFSDNTGSQIIQPVYNGNNQLIHEAGHAMLIVGYDAKKQYFIIKNSWGPQWGKQGYAYISYNYARTYFKYGFVITKEH